MEKAAFIRKMDDLGRIVLPKRIRKVLKINEQDSIEIFVEDEKVILRKYLEGKACFVTGTAIDLAVEFSLLQGLTQSRLIKFYYYPTPCR